MRGIVPPFAVAFFNNLSQVGFGLILVSVLQSGWPRVLLSIWGAPSMRCDVLFGILLAWSLDNANIAIGAFQSGGSTPVLVCLDPAFVIYISIYRVSE